MPSGPIGIASKSSGESEPEPDLKQPSAGTSEASSEKIGSVSQPVSRVGSGSEDSPNELTVTEELYKKSGEEDSDETLE